MKNINILSTTSSGRKVHNYYSKKRFRYCKLWSTTNSQP